MAEPLVKIYKSLLFFLYKKMTPETIILLKVCIKLSKYNHTNNCGSYRKTFVLFLLFTSPFLA